MLCYKTSLQLPLISFQRDKNIGSFWSTVHSKQMINPELSNAIAHDEKIVLSFTKLRKCRDRSDPLRSVIILQLDLIAKSCITRAKAKMIQEDD